MSIQSSCRRILILLIVTAAISVRGAVHNPSLTAESVIILGNPATSSPAVAVNITWPSGPPTEGTLTVTIDSGTDQICLLGDDGAELAENTRSWNRSDGEFPQSFNIKAKAPSSDVNDVVINVRHDTGPIGAKQLTVAKIELRSVSFSSSGGGTNYIELKSDDDQTTFDAPHWLDTSEPLNGVVSDQGDRNYPAAFIRNTSPGIAAEFKVTPSALTAELKVQAGAPEGETAAVGFEISPPVSVSPAEGILTLTSQTSATSLPDTVEYYESASMAWKIGAGEGAAVEVARSKHRVYVVLATPSTAHRQETVFQIGCQGAEGKTDAGEIIAVIWGKFSGGDLVTASDSETLKYYHSFNTSSNTGASLLETADGTCDAWVSLFAGCMNIHGLTAPANYQIAKISPLVDSAFIVKNWNYSGSGSSPSATHPFLNIGTTNYRGDNAYNWVFCEVADQPGLAGQVNPNPASLFRHHTVVGIGDLLYDPSMKTTYSGLSDFVANSVAGLVDRPQDPSIDEKVLGVDANGNGNTTDTGVKVPAFLFRKDHAVSDFEIIYSN